MLTCIQNFITKAGAQKYAEKYGIALVCPDTSPRGTDFPGEHESYDFGSGAGFYVNATQSPWNVNYNMYDYVTQVHMSLSLILQLPNLPFQLLSYKELPALVEANLPVLPGVRSVSGHSMGGHGALITALKNPVRGYVFFRFK